MDTAHLWRNIPDKLSQRDEVGHIDLLSKHIAEGEAQAALELLESGKIAVDEDELGAAPRESLNASSDVRQNELLKTWG